MSTDNSLYSRESVLGLEQFGLLRGEGLKAILDYEGNNQEVYRALFQIASDRLESGDIKGFRELTGAIKQVVTRNEVTDERVFFAEQALVELSYACLCQQRREPEVLKQTVAAYSQTLPVSPRLMLNLVLDHPGLFTADDVLKALKLDNFMSIASDELLKGGRSSQAIVDRFARTRGLDSAKIYDTAQYCSIATAMAMSSNEDVASLAPAVFDAVFSSPFFNKQSTFNASFLHSLTLFPMVMDKLTPVFQKHEAVIVDKFKELRTPNAHELMSSIGNFGLKLLGVDGSGNLPQLNYRTAEALADAGLKDLGRLTFLRAKDNFIEKDFIANMAEKVGHFDVDDLITIHNNSNYNQTSFLEQTTASNIVSVIDYAEQRGLELPIYHLRINSYKQLAQIQTEAQSKQGGDYWRWKQITDLAVKGFAVQHQQIHLDTWEHLHEYMATAERQQKKAKGIRRTYDEGPSF